MNFGFRWLILALIILALSAGVFVVNHAPLTGIDDANIFFVYARNLATGRGLVFSPGGERVEGYTSFLWLLICAAVFWISPNYPEFTLILLNTILLSLGLVYVMDSVYSDIPDAPSKFPTLANIFFLTWVFASPVFLSWTVLSLMDVGIFSVLLLFLYAEITRLGNPPLTRAGVIRASVLIFLLLLTRPEGIIYAGLYLLLIGFTVLFQCKKKSNWRYVTILVVVFGGTLAALSFFRLLYFGWLLPNTYYAKVSPYVLYNMSQGAIYLRDFLVRSPLAWIGLSAITFRSLFLLHKWRMIASRERIADVLYEIGAYWIILTGLLLPVLTGGDHFRYHRFYQPIYPFFSLPVLFSIPWRRLQFFSPKGIRWVVICVLFGGILFFAQPNWLNYSADPEIAHEYRIAAMGRMWGASLNSLAERIGEYPSVGDVVVGGLAYRYRGEIVDLMGLNNVSMAHAPGTKVGVKNHASFSTEIFFQLRPAIVLPRVIEEASIPVEFLGCGPVFYREALKDLLCTPAFRDDYQPIVVSLETEMEQVHIFFYARDDFKQVLIGADLYP